MTNFSPIPLQQAIYAALSGDSALNSLISGVFDHVPQNTPYPYITLGDALVNDWSSKTSAGTRQQLTLLVWSREGGRKQPATIMERVVALLHNATLTLTGETLVSLRFASSEINLLDDGVTYRASVQFRAFTQLNE